VCPADAAKFLGAIDSDKRTAVGDVELIRPVGFSLGMLANHLSSGGTSDSPWNWAAVKARDSGMSRAGMWMVDMGPLSILVVAFYPRENPLSGVKKEREICGI
jgi:hypothetical protein